MAVVVQTLVPHASQGDADRLDQLVNGAITRRGGPPEGLMAHIGHPSGAGFVICDVWRSEAEMESFYDEVVLPKLAEASLERDDLSSLPSGHSPDHDHGRSDEPISRHREPS